MGNLTGKKYTISRKTFAYTILKKKVKLALWHLTPNHYFLRAFLQAYVASVSARVSREKRDESKNRNERWEPGEKKKQRFLYVYLFSSPFLHFLAYWLFFVTWWTNRRTSTGHYTPSALIFGVQSFVHYRIKWRVCYSGQFTSSTTRTTKTSKLNVSRVGQSCHFRDFYDLNEELLRSYN